MHRGEWLYYGHSESGELLLTCLLAFRHLRVKMADVVTHELQKEGEDKLPKR